MRWPGGSDRFKLPIVKLVDSCEKPRVGDRWWWSPPPQIQAFAVCSQSSQGSTLHPQCGNTTAGPVVTAPDSSTGACVVSVDCRVAPPTEPLVAVTESGIQRKKGVTSAAFGTYQIFFAASQRAPRTLASSFSGYGTFKSILMAGVNYRRHAPPSLPAPPLADRSCPSFRFPHFSFPSSIWASKVPACSLNHCPKMLLQLFQLFPQGNRLFCSFSINSLQRIDLS